MVRKLVLCAVVAFLIDLTFTMGGAQPGSSATRVLGPMHWWFTQIIERVIDGGLNA